MTCDLLNDQILALLQWSSCRGTMAGASCTGQRQLTPLLWWSTERSCTPVLSLVERSLLVLEPWLGPQFPLGSQLGLGMLILEFNLSTYVYS